jgi:hypothetical protein
MILRMTTDCGQVPRAASAGENRRALIVQIKPWALLRVDLDQHPRRQPFQSNGYSFYNRALDRLRRLMPSMQLAVRNQRLLFLFWSSTSILAVYEGALNAKCGSRLRGRRRIRGSPGRL